MAQASSGFPRPINGLVCPNGSGHKSAQAFERLADERLYFWRWGMPFLTVDEMRVCEALLSVQARLEPNKTLSIVSNPRMRVVGRHFQPDLLVVYRGRAGVIEVDGSSHRTSSLAAERSRDRLLENGGVALVDHLSVEEASNPAELRIFVERFVDRLGGFQS